MPRLSSSRFLSGCHLTCSQLRPQFGAVCTIKGCLKCGLNFLFLPVYPMRPGATLMSAFLFNIGLVLLAVSASILFCAQAFSLYANSTAIQDIFGNQVSLSLHLDLTELPSISKPLLSSFRSTVTSFVICRLLTGWSDCNEKAFAHLIQDYLCGPDRGSCVCADVELAGHQIPLQHTCLHLLHVWVCWLDDLVPCGAWARPVEETEARRRVRRWIVLHRQAGCSQHTDLHPARGCAKV